MAKDTPNTLNQSVIYEVYVRNHTEEGTFQSLVKDLDRIKGLGVDVIWLMPIHPIGQKGRKGSLGCPYAVQDYGQVNPEYGTLEDFKSLLEEIHDRGMACIIDVVYNHTAWDSKLLAEHPEYFYHENGAVANRIEEWHDVVDLDYSHIALWDIQIGYLEYWVKLGVDGFRCDVASMVAVAFWKAARKRLKSLCPPIFLLAESVEQDFITELRQRGFYAASDGELYEAFDILYDYDVFPDWKAYFKGLQDIKPYFDGLKRQTYLYPADSIKLRYLENHDNPRMRYWLKNPGAIWQWTLFTYLQKGTVLLYGGQETYDRTSPSLFEKDPVHWELDEAYSLYLGRLKQWKKERLMAEGTYQIKTYEVSGAISLIYHSASEWLFSLFNFENKSGAVAVDLPDGDYINAYNGAQVRIDQGKMALSQEPLVIWQDRSGGPKNVTMLAF